MVVDMPPPIPTAYYNSVGDAAFRKAPKAAGAWNFVSQELNSNVKYERFEDYFDATRKPNWKNLVFQIVPDETSRVAGLKTRRGRHRVRLERRRGPAVPGRLQQHDQGEQGHRQWPT